MLIRRMLQIDAVTCIATGAVLSLFGQPLSGLFGLPAALLFYAGLALLPIGAFMAALAARRKISHAGAWLVIVGNAGWVGASIAVLIALAPTALGAAFLIAQAVVVALLAELEYVGLRRAA
jgi:hypothetical protein